MANPGPYASFNVQWTYPVQPPSGDDPQRRFSWPPMPTPSMMFMYNSPLVMQPSHVSWIPPPISSTPDQSWVAQQSYASPQQSPHAQAQFQGEPAPSQAQYQVYPTPSQAQYQVQPTPPQPQFYAQSVPPEGQFHAQPAPPQAQFHVQPTPPQAQFHVQPSPDPSPSPRLPSPSWSRSRSQSRSRPPSRARPEAGPPLYFYNRDDPYYEFTNFAPYGVWHEGRMYPTSEHLFQAHKFLETDPSLAEVIRQQPTPRAALQEATRNRASQRRDWYHVNIFFMGEILEAKFTQHANLREMLLGTGDRELIEDSPVDSFWGCGNDRRGKNELGKCLMRLRDKLRREDRQRGMRAGSPMRQDEPFQGY